MLGEYPQTGHEIRNYLAASVSPSTVANLPSRDTFRGYCANTFSKHGIVEVEGGHFCLSDAGERYGKPIAAFSLRYAVDSGRSLYEVFGPTYSSGGSRSPGNRARILEKLAEGCGQIARLEKELGLDRASVRTHLRQLQSIGLAAFEPPKIAICKSGLSALKGYIEPVKNALKDGQELGHMQRLLREFERDERLFRKYLSRGIELYRKASSSMNRQDAEDRAHELLEFIHKYYGAHGIGPSPRDAEKALEWTHGNVKWYLKSLLEKGRVEREMSNDKIRYRAR